MSFTPVATLVILIGLLRGTVFGPVQNLSILFGTTYGITFLMAFLTSGVTFLWGLLVLTRESKKLQILPTNAKEQAEYNAVLGRVKIFTLLELVDFFIILTCMILMRFGY